MMELEQITWTYYQGLEQGKLVGRKCKECGAVEFPPHYACNECGCPETEWVELSGEGTLQRFVVKGVITQLPYLDDISKDYAYGVVKLAEGPEFTCVVFGIKKRDEAALKERMATGEGVPVKPLIMQRDGFKVLYFEVA